MSKASLVLVEFVSGVSGGVEPVPLLDVGEGGNSLAPVTFARAREVRNEGEV